MRKRTAKGTDVTVGVNEVNVGPLLTRQSTRLSPFAVTPFRVRTPVPNYRHRKTDTKRYLFFYGTPTGVRTLDTLIKSQVLYQLS